MSRKYKFHNPNGAYFISFAVVDWIHIFTRNKYNNIIIKSLQFCQKEKGLELFAWCLMPNHIHLMARATDGFLLQDILRDFKKFTSKAIKETITENGHESRKEWLLSQFEKPEGFRFWQADNKPIELWSNAVIKQKLDYIHQNPVEDGLVYRPEDYLYSSASAYAGEEGLLDVMLIG